MLISSRPCLATVLIISLCLVFESHVLAAENAPQTSRPNFVVLLVDDLGWGDFGCYGAKFYETPHIDRLASGGMKFTNAYAACTVCSPSRAALLTGCYPARLHLTDWITGHVNPHARLTIPDWNMRVPRERLLLPEALQQAGYRTAFFGKWHLMPIGSPDFDQHYPTSHGFDINIGGREWGQPKGPGKYFSPFGMPNLDDGEPGDFLTDKLTDAAVEFLDGTSRQQPFLLYLSYYTLHGPIMAPETAVAKYRQKAKDFVNEQQEHLNPKRAGMVDRLDASVGRLVAKLNELGIADNTVIVLTGDNGGDYDGTTGGLRDFKGYSHEGATREPFIVRWPDKVRPGSICNEMIIGMDIYPTFLEMAGLPLRPEEHRDGISIAPLLTGDRAELDRDKLYWHYPHYHRTVPYGAIRHDNWKLIEFYEDQEIELFDLGADPTESNNLAQSNPNKAAQLLGELSAWRESVGAQMMTSNPNHDPVKSSEGWLKSKKRFEAKQDAASK